VKRGLYAIAAACALVAAVIGVAGGQAARAGAHSPYAGGRYIVTFADEAVASYTG
jgi:hypothetical protein